VEGLAAASRATRFFAENPDHEDGDLGDGRRCCTAAAARIQKRIAIVQLKRK